MEGPPAGGCAPRSRRETVRGSTVPSPPPQVGRIVVACRKQGGAGPRPASGEDAQPTCPALHRARTPNPHAPPCIGRDAQPTRWVGQSGSRIVREARRRRAGERWRQRNACRSSRAAVGSSLSAREDRRDLPGTGRGGTPACIGRGRPTHMPRPASGGTPNPLGGSGKVGRASCARLAGVAPASDGVNGTRVVPLARR